MSAARRAAFLSHILPVKFYTPDKKRGRENRGMRRVRYVSRDNAVRYRGLTAELSDKGV